MTHVTLYDDQTAFVSDIQSAMRRTKNVLACLPTGGGKTRVAAHMIDRIRLKGNRAGFMVPRRELLRQTTETMQELRIPHGHIAAGYPVNPFAKVQLITSGTLARRLDKSPKLDVLFVDECHFGGAELDRIIRHYQAQGTWVIGLSATPMKTSGQGMGDWYNELVQGPSIRWLMDHGRLSDYRLFAPNRPDLSGIKTVAGDYAKGELSSYMESDRVLIGNAAKHYKAHAMGRLNVVFCTSIKHAEITCQVFKDAGIPSAVVHGKMADDEIAATVKAFAGREIMALCSVDLLTFGFDLAQAARMDVTVECLSDLRPTKSLPLQLQKWGRALRMKEEPALIFDHAGNSHESMHGLPDTDREWTLEAMDKKKRGDTEKTEPTRQCSECFFVHRPSPCCPNCGFEYPVMGRMIEEVEGELEEFTGRKMTPKQEIGMIARTEGLQGLIAYGRSKGYSPGWARKQAQIRRMV